MPALYWLVLVLVTVARKDDRYQSGLEFEGEFLSIEAASALAFNREWLWSGATAFQIRDMHSYHGQILEVDWFSASLWVSV